MPQIQPADLTLRGRTLVVVVAVVAAGAALARWLERWLGASPDVATTLHRIDIVIGAMAVLAIPMLVLAARLWRDRSRAVAAGRFPPPGMRVLFATPVVTGRAAVWRGRRLKLGAALLGMVVVATPAVLGYLVRAIAARL